MINQNFKKNRTKNVSKKIFYFLKNYSKALTKLYSQITKNISIYDYVCVLRSKKSQIVVKISFGNSKNFFCKYN
jgi:hypothetical protein